MLDHYNNFKGSTHNDLEYDSAYSTIVSSGIVYPDAGVITISSTPGNFLLVFFINREESPGTNVDGWKVWGGYAPLRITSDIYQKVWTLSKISTGNDSLKPHLISLGNYVIFYELTNVKLDDPLVIGCAPIIIPPSETTRISKSCDKFIIFAGHSLLGSTGVLWQTTGGMPIIAGVTGDGRIYALATVADSSKITDWSIGTANKITMRYNTAYYCSILPVAINHL